jgi:GH15 family glucan-1,4-alpha-glucosidase
VLYGRSFHPTQIIRIIKPISGHPRIVIRCKPAFDYGTERCDTSRGSNHVTYRGKDFLARLTTDAPISFVIEEIPFVLTEEFGMILGPDESLTRAPRTVIHEFYENTRSYWSHFTRMLKIPFEYQEEVIRAAITLKLCSYEESGAIIAALTTSIPEAPHSGRNWDYRFCWLRDAYHTVRALNYLGATETMEHYLRFIINIVSSAKYSDLQPLYGLLMQTEVPESVSKNLSGYQGMGPVRRGNEAYVQIQNDNYGSVILAVCQMFFDERIENQADYGLFTQLEHIGLLSVKSYKEPDAGLWELRGSLRLHTFSVVMCWAACDRLGKIAKKLNLEDRTVFWFDHAKQIRDFILENAWDPIQECFTSAMFSESKSVDSCLLLLAELGFIEASDNRFVKTVERIEKELKFGDFLYRYVEEDDFGAPENAFTICTFWYINALYMIGKKQEARDLFENVLRCRNHVGLLSEDIDPKTGELWGNFPQTYSMVGLINCAIRLSVEWTEAGLC